MKIWFRASLSLFIWSALIPLAAQNINSNEIKSLDGQVQEIKSDVLSIAAELDNLEERLLFPSNTQLSIFVAVSEEEDFRLDAVKVDVDGALAAHHIYSFKELDALQNGGVQRLYTGNITTGQHRINVTMIGKLKSGKEFSESQEFTFAKNVEPRALGVRLASPGLGRSGIEVGDW
jgi:hypothetical protein